MTELLIYGGLLYAVYVDTQSLKQQDGVLYDEILQFSSRKWVVLILLLSFALVPVYLLRRGRFMRTLRNNRRNPAGLPEPAGVSFKNDAAGIFIKWFFIIALSTLLLEWVSLFFDIFNNHLDELVASALFYSGLMVFLIYQATKAYPDGFWSQVGFPKEKQPWLKVLILPFAAGIALAFLVAYAMMARESVPSTPLSEALDATRSSSAFVSFFGVALLIAPLFEELIFRGYFFGVISRFKGRNFAIISVAGIFALLHVGQYWGDGLAILVVVILGLSLTWLRSFCQTTLASVIAHYTYNILITLIPILILIASSPAYFTYQVFYNELNDSMKEKLLIATIEKQPDLMDAYNDLAWLYAQGNRNLDEALTLVDEALSFDEDNGAYLDTKAEILFRSGQIEEAIAIEEEALKGDPVNVIFQKQLRRFKEGLVLSESL